MGKLTKEEELLLSSYSATSSTKGNLFFYLNALIISIAPLYLFYGVHQMEVSRKFYRLGKPCETH